MSYGINAYQQVDRSAASYADPWRLVAMLFEGALERVAQARGAMQRGDVAVKGERIGKAMAIIDGLHGSLDQERGGEIADNLGALYDYMVRRLLDANLQNDIEALDEVASLLREVKEGWDAIPPEYRNAAAPGEAVTGTTG